MDYEQKFKLLVSFLRGVNVSVIASHNSEIQIEPVEIMELIMAEIKGLEINKEESNDHINGGR